MEQAMIKLTAPENHCCVGFGGSEYAVKDGAVTVPEAAVAALAAHGYRRAEAAAAPRRR